MKCDGMVRLFKAGTLSVNKKTGKRTLHNEDVYVRCGSCYACRITRLRSWIFRFQQEETHCVSSYFVTLTYSTEHVPITELGHLTLNYKDVQLFLKRLRKENSNKIRFCCVGEYGSQGDRPHYHLLMFNLDPFYNPFKNSWFNADIEYQVTKLEKLWGKGLVHVGTVTNKSIAYCMDYVMTKRVSNLYDRDREFCVFSKGIGSDYIDDATLKFHQANLDKISVNYQGDNYPMPRYYKNRLFDDKQLKIVAKNMQEHDQETEAEYRRRLGDDGYNRLIQNRREFNKARLEKKFKDGSNKLL